MGKGKKSGAQALFDALKAKGYKQMGGEKLLMKAGGMVDFAEMAADKMRYGGDKYGYGGATKEMKMGGTSGRSTYSGSKKKKAKKK